MQWLALVSCSGIISIPKASITRAINAELLYKGHCGQSIEGHGQRITLTCTFPWPNDVATLHIERYVLTIGIQEILPAAGHTWRMLWRATDLFKALNAFEASISITPSTSHLPNSWVRASTATSQADGIPTHSWDGAVACKTSASIVAIMTLPIIRRKTSPTAIGRAPVFFARGIRRPAR